MFRLSHPLKKNTKQKWPKGVKPGRNNKIMGFFSLKFPLKTIVAGSWKPFLLNSLGRWCHFRAYSFVFASNFQTSNKKGGCLKIIPITKGYIIFDDHTSLHDINQSRVVLFTDHSWMLITPHLEAHDDADRKSPRIAGTWPPAYPFQHVPSG